MADMMTLGLSVEDMAARSSVRREMTCEMLIELLFLTAFA